MASAFVVAKRSTVDVILYPFATRLKPLTMEW
jgi:hypothetical protein